MKEIFMASQEKKVESQAISHWMRMQALAELPLLVILAVVACLSAAADIMVAYVLKMFTDAAAGETTFPLRNIVVIAACVLVGVGITAITSAFLKAKIQGRIEINIRQQILTSVLNGKYSQVQQLHTGDTLTKLTSDAAAVAEYYPRVATDIVGSALQFLLAVIAIFLLNFKVALLITVVMPLLVLAISLFNTPIGRADERQKREEEKSRVLIQEYLDLNKLIKLFGVQSRCLANTGCQFEKTYKSKIYFGIWDGVASFLNSMVGNAILLITLGGGAYLAIKGETTVGTLIAMTQLFNYIMKPFSKVAGAVSANAQAKTSAGRIYSILGVPKVDQPAGTAENIGMISLRNVWFGYGDEKVLQGVEATFLRGNAYCIVGENGSGKTTLINLIAGLLSPEKGMVCVKDTKGHDLGRLNGFCTSFVPAEPSLFSDSIRDNITLFDVPVDEDRFTRAVNMALVDAFASDFPNGYDTLIGQHGSTVSSGQAQRIAIARAIYWNSDIMIFDEPTSNLDRTSVDILKESIRQLKQDKIVIVISHEQSFESACDVCYHLEEGKLKQI